MPDPFTIFLLGSLVLFAIGMVIGWQFSQEESVFTQSNLIVTIVWVASIAAEILIPAYSVSFLIHGIMGAVVGYLFADDGFDITIGG
jgi:hypothetical protein